ncbi:MAG: ABC transporter permease, partial [Burkholderiales bacterium]
MRWIRLKAIAVKEILQIWRDPRSLLIALAMPAMQILLLGYGVSLDLKHIPLCVFDREGSQYSRELLQRFSASLYFSVTEIDRSYPQLMNAIDKGTCKLGIVVPPDFSERLSDLRSSSVQAIADATDDNTANLAMSYAQSVVGGFSGDVQLWWAGAAGQGKGVTQPLSVESRVWFNEDLESRNFIIPGIVALIMALVGAQLTSLTISREWERGTMELLVSTPVKPIEVMLGKLIPYFAIGLVDAAFCLMFAVFWFHVPFRGTLATLFLTTALFLIVVLGIGYMISVAIRSQLGASQIALLLTMLPTTVLSGYAFPIDQMPAPIQALTYVVY